VRRWNRLEWPLLDSKTLLTFGAGILYDISHARITPIRNRCKRDRAASLPEANDHLTSSLSPSEAPVEMKMESRAA
jgi:hypothetical protein